MFTIPSMTTSAQTEKLALNISTCPNSSFCFFSSEMKHRLSLRRVSAGCVLCVLCKPELAQIVTQLLLLTRHFALAGQCVFPDLQKTSPPFKSLHTSSVSSLSCRRTALTIFGHFHSHLHFH